MARLLHAPAVETPTAHCLRKSRPGYASPPESVSKSFSKNQASKSPALRPVPNAETVG